MATVTILITFIKLIIKVNMSQYLNYSHSKFKYYVA